MWEGYRFSGGGTSEIGGCDPTPSSSDRIHRSSSNGDGCTDGIRRGGNIAAGGGSWAITSGISNSGLEPLRRSNQDLICNSFTRDGSVQGQSPSLM